jgi:molybdopterin/thiamine biosynthesis adenylyltransferase
MSVSFVISFKPLKPNFLNSNNMVSEFYELITSRNLGMIDENEQEILRKSKVAICGLGGIGSPVAEMLVRLGIENFSLCDHGTFEPSNSNRQIYSYTDTNGQWKTDVTETFFRKVNPAVRIAKFNKLTLENHTEFLDGADVVILAADAMLPILLLSRKSRELSIPLIEAWALAYGNVRVFTRDTPSLEEVYGFPTTGREISEISKEEQSELLYKSIFDVAASFSGVMEYYPDRALKKMREEKIGTTLSPLVWLSSVLMAIETLKILLNKGELALAPSFKVFDPFKFRCFET